MSEIPERCAPFEEDLSALLDEQLDARRASEVRAHLASCAECTQRLGALRAVDLALERLAARPVDAPQRARMRPVLAPAKPARRAPLRSRRWIATAALVATAAGAATLMLVWRPTPPAAPPVETVIAEQARADAEVAARELAAKIDRSTVAGSPPAPLAESAGGIASPDLLDDASDEDLALATALHEFPVLDSPRDLELVEQLDLIEALGALDGEPAGRG